VNILCCEAFLHQSYQAVSKIMKSRYVSKHAKLKMYTTVIKPIIIYGCERWAMTEQMKSSLKTWEKKIGILKKYMAQ
jgi:hypothetical protein